jgi:adenylate cyclase
MNAGLRITDLLSTLGNTWHPLMREQRRLVALMYTDIIGYTSLGQKNEPLALALLKDQRKIIRAVLSSHEGREIKTMGDAFLIEFPSALEATKCAYEIQKSVREHNASKSGHEIIHLRIGLHLGDVIESGNDISGDAVNVASRIEPLADDGGVFLTRQVYDQVHNKFEERVESVGLKKLKNVDLPVEVYKVVMPWESISPRSSLSRKRVAVLPFVNISPDPNDEYFSDGLTEEVITRLSELRDLEVIARTSIMRYKRTDKSVAQIGAELSAGVLLEGSVRKVGDRIRVTAQLVDSNTESHLWAEKFDRDVGDIFSVQSEIAEKVARSLEIKLLSSHGKDTNDLTAYRMYLKATQLIHAETEGSLLEAITLLEGAVARDRKFVRAYSGLAYAWMGLSNFEEFAVAAEKAEHAALKAIELGIEWAESHAAMSKVHLILDRFDSALQEAERAVELNPNLADAYYSLGIIHTVMGVLDRAVEAFSKAIELDPLSFIARFSLAELLFLAHKEKEALEVSQKLKELHPNNPRTYLVPSYLYIFKREFGKAQEFLEEGRKIDPDEPLLRLNQGVLYALEGKKKEAEDTLKLIEKDQIESNRLLGRLYVQAALGNVQDAMDALMRMSETHSWPPWIKSDPVFRKLRTNDRFREFCRKAGIPPS